MQRTLVQNSEYEEAMNSPKSDKLIMAMKE